MALKYHPVSNHIGIRHSSRPVIPQCVIFVGQEQGRRGGSQIQRDCRGVWSVERPEKAGNIRHLRGGRIEGRRWRRCWPGRLQWDARRRWPAVLSIPRRPTGHICRVFWRGRSVCSFIRRRKRRPVWPWWSVAVWVWSWRCGDGGRGFRRIWVSRNGW